MCSDRYSGGSQKLGVDVGRGQGSEKEMCPHGLGPWYFFGSGLTGIKKPVVMRRRVVAQM